nr:hypothetical protein [Enterobacter hormaechei]
MADENCPREWLIIAPEEQNLLAEIDALLGRAAAQKDGLAIDDLWIKATVPRRKPRLPAEPATRHIVTRGDRVVMTIPPKGNPVLVEDIFLRRFPSDGDRIPGAPEGNGTVRTQTLQEAKAGVTKAEEKILKKILSGSHNKKRRSL